MKQVELNQVRLYTIIYDCERVCVNFDRIKRYLKMK